MPGAGNDSRAQPAMRGGARITAFVVDRPILFGAVAVALTVVVARLLNYVYPRTHLPLIPGMRVHHYVFGIFILTIAGYLALLFKGPRATFWIALLYGLGVGLTFDEFSFWFNPPRAVIARCLLYTSDAADDLLCVDLG